MPFANILRYTQKCIWNIEIVRSGIDAIICLVGQK